VFPCTAGLPADRIFVDSVHRSWRRIAVSNFTDSSIIYDWYQMHSNETRGLCNVAVACWPKKCNYSKWWWCYFQCKRSGQSAVPSSCIPPLQMSSLITWGSWRLPGPSDDRRLISVQCVSKQHSCCRRTALRSDTICVNIATGDGRQSVVSVEQLHRRSQRGAWGA